MSVGKSDYFWNTPRSASEAWTRRCSVTRRRLMALVTLGVLHLVSVSAVFGQGAIRNDAPIGWYVMDVYGSVVPFGQNVGLAASRGFATAPLPGLGLGLTGGAHIFPIRFGVITIGVGATWHTAFGDKRPGETDPDPEGPTLRTRFAAIAPQLSLNFGGQDGWSYVSAGPGTSRLSLFALDGDEPTQRRAGTFNYGGGARWFTSDHIAFSLDLRFYNAGPLAATATEPTSPRSTIMVINIGASFK